MDRIHRHRGSLWHRLARELEDRLLVRREHADRVTAWISEGELTVANRSGHPIHALEVSYTQDSDNREDAAETRGLGFVLPGETAVPLPAGTASQIPAITFTDARGHGWRRDVGKPPILQHEG